MNHAHIFALAYIYKNNHNLSFDTISRILREMYPTLPTSFSPVDVKNMLETGEKSVKTRHLVNAMYDLGYSKSYIQQTLKLTQQAVSYHLKTKKSKQYINPYLYALQKHHQAYN